MFLGWILLKTFIMNDNSDGNVMLRLSESKTNLESYTSQNNWY